MGLPARSRLALTVAALSLAAYAGGAAADPGNVNGNGPPPHAGGHGNNGKHKGRPARAVTMLHPPEGAADEDAFGRADVKFFPAVGNRMERSWLRIKLCRLDASTEYTLWGDDPADGTTDLVQFATFTTSEFGRSRYAQDTKHEGTLPFGATLEALGGTVLEVRSADGTTTVLVGTIPDMTP